MNQLLFQSSNYYNDRKDLFFNNNIKNHKYFWEKKLVDKNYDSFDDYEGSEKDEEIK